MTKVKINGQVTEPVGYKAKINGQIVTPTALRIKKNGQWVNVWEDWSPIIDKNLVLYDGVPSSGMQDIVIKSQMSKKWLDKALEQGYYYIYTYYRIESFDVKLKDVGFGPYGESYVLTTYRGTASNPLQSQLDNYFLEYGLWQTDAYYSGGDQRDNRYNIQYFFDSYTEYNYKINAANLPKTGHRLRVTVLKNEVVKL